MALNITQLFNPATQPDWLKTLLTNAKILKLTTTQWQPGGIARTILAIVSYVLQIEDIQISLIAQGGFLDFAANGSVTYTDINGKSVTIYVTPDPSNPAQNPSGRLGWLDVLASSVYNVERIQTTFAGGNLAIINSSVATYGPFAPGSYHVADIFPSNSPTYSNTSILSIPPSTTVGGGVTNVTNNGGTIQITTLAAHGLQNGSVVMLSGIQGVSNVSGARTYALSDPTAWEVTVLSSATFTLNGSNFSGSYTAGGTVWIPVIAPFQADVAGSNSNSLNQFGVVDVNTILQPVTSLNGVNPANYVKFVGQDIENNTALANRCRLKLQSISTSGTKGAYMYYALTSQQVAPNVTNPATGFPYNVSTTITRVMVSAIIGTVSVIIANAQGSPSAQDVAAVQAIIAAYATPLGVNSIVTAAPPLNIAIVANVWVSASLNNTSTQAIFQTAIQNYVANFPIGGVSDPGGQYQNIMPLDGIIGTIFTAGQANGISIQDVNMVDGGIGGITADVDLVVVGIAYVAVLSPGVPTVNLFSI